MARIHGKNGRLYVDLAGGGSATPVAFLTKWTADFTTAKIDVTALGDANYVYVAGLPDSKGTITGWYDDATPQLYTAALDGIARKMYLYPNTLTSIQYWSGTAFFDFTVTGGVAEATAISGTWSAGSAIVKTG
jgi:hypothetical protein